MFNQHTLSQQSNFVQAIFSDYAPEFALALLPVLYHEGALRPDGGLNNRVSDRGGLTKYGISQRAYPELDIKHLTLEDAVKLYWRDYYQPMKCSHFTAAEALMLLDGAVQHGVPSMSKLAQHAVGAQADGIIGPLTIKKLRDFNQIELIAKLLSARGSRYARIVADDQTQIANLNGWFNRLSHISTLCYIGVLEHG